MYLRKWSRFVSSHAIVRDTGVVHCSVGAMLSLAHAVICRDCWCLCSDAWEWWSKLLTVDTNVCTGGTLNTYHYCIVHWFISETTLNLPNLNTLLERVSHDWYDIAYWMNIPPSKRYEIKRQHSGDAQRCSRACCELYLEDHPFPTWQLVAYALYKGCHLKELEVVLKKYLKGEWAMIISHYQYHYCV